MIKSNGLLSNLFNYFLDRLVKLYNIVECGSGIRINRLSRGINHSYSICHISPPRAIYLGVIRSINIYNTYLFCPILLPLIKFNIIKCFRGIIKDKKVLLQIKLKRGWVSFLREEKSRTETPLLYTRIRDSSVLFASLSSKGVVIASPYFRIMPNTRMGVT